MALTAFEPRIKRYSTYEVQIMPVENKSSVDSGRRERIVCSEGRGAKTCYYLRTINAMPALNATFSLTMARFVA